MQGVVKLEQVQDRAKLLNQQKVIRLKVKAILHLQNQLEVKVAAQKVVLVVVQEAVAQKVILQEVVLDHLKVLVLQEVRAQVQAEVVAEAVVEVKDK